MRIKKAIAVLLCVAMVLSLISVEAFAATGTATVSVETTATNVQAGDTVNYTVYLGDCAGLSDEGGLYNLDFNISVPDGLTFVAKSGDVDSNFSTATGFGMPAFNEAKMKFSSMGTLASGYVGGKIPVMTFSCTVNAGAAGEKEVTLENVVFAASSGTFTALVKSATVKVPVPVTGVTLDKNELSLDLKNNKTATLTATVAPDTATDKAVTWSSSADGVATVDETGKVTAASEGKATITATAGDKSASCEVTVVNCLHTQRQLVNAKDSTCTEKGWDAYYTCDCGVKLGSDGTTVIAAVPEKELAAHDFSKEDVTAVGALKTSGDCTKKAVYYKSCTVCGKVSTTETFESAIGAHALVDVEAKEPTCTKPGNIAYKHCSVCEKNFNASGEELKSVEVAAKGHTGGTANCKNLAVCTTCGQPYGELGKHVLVTHVKEDATCTEPGYETYYTCSVDGCGKMFSDAEGTTEITEIPAISAKGHTTTKIDAKDATCTEAGNNEYYKCSACNKLFSDAEGNTATTAEDVTIAAKGHTMTKTAAVAPTCTVGGNNEYYYCSACENYFKDEDGETKTTVKAETIAALGHTMTKTDAKDATCEAAGNNEYYYCSVCESYFKDKDGVTPTKPDAEKVEPLGHDYGTQIAEVPATCTKEGTAAHYKCSRCEELFLDTASGNAVTAESLVIEKVPHTSSDSYAYTTTEHWKFCTVCGEKLYKAAHVFTEDATAGTKTCQTCGYVVHTADAGDEHVCTPVDQWSFDDNSHWHICEGCNEKCNEAAHSFGEWVTDVEATATSTGLRHRTCKECKYVQQEVIAKISTTPTTPSHRPSSGTGSATSSDKVQSSKTFDAGIATYVGLSILSLTGSALVIGKKKEF